jgi:hypothetical protein
MSNGRFCLIRDLGLVKGGKGLKHHEVVLELSCRGLFRFATSRIRMNSRTRGPASQEAEAQMETTWSST